MGEKTIPIHPDLLRWLDTNYPERCPDLGMSEREIFAATGARQLVRRLHALAQRQDRDNVTPVTL